MTTASASNMLKKLDGLGYVTRSSARGSSSPSRAPGRARGDPPPPAARDLSGHAARDAVGRGPPRGRGAGAPRLRGLRGPHRRGARPPGARPARAPDPAPAGQLATLPAAPVGARRRGPGGGGRVNDRDDALLRFLAERGLVPDATLQVLEHAPFGGPISVRVGGRMVEVPPAAARAVHGIDTTSRTVRDCDPSLASAHPNEENRPPFARRWPASTAEAAAAGPRGGPSRLPTRPSSSSGGPAPTWCGSTAAGSCGVCANYRGPAYTAGETRRAARSAARRLPRRPPHAPCCALEHAGPGPRPRGPGRSISASQSLSGPSPPRSPPPARGRSGRPRARGAAARPPRPGRRRRSRGCGR